jgi:putative nucleotidyltransferase with HDIG domain
MTGQNGLACLVVDDEPRLRRVLVHLLEGDGFQVREAGTGVEALQVMEVDPAPLVISDLRMPEMDGVNLLRHLQQRWPDTAVVMVSAVADVDMAVKCLHLGALDYVSKPFNLDEVRARVDQALQRRLLKLELKAYQEQLEARVKAQADRIEELFLGGVQALAQALEAKDAYLRGHSLRVSEYAVRIARQVGLDADSVDTISLGGHLHDIGKIGVSEEVLHKAGRLTDGEYRHIMEHPVIGARILGPLLSDAPQVIAIVRSHHERMDGKGLPDGVKADKLPMLVRIVSVADAFDAMTSERPYRHSLPVERALDELRVQSGVQWDPAAVDGFLGAFPDVHYLPVKTPGSTASAISSTAG